MKEWFKYEFGYVNIDSENLFLTNSGNWSETQDMQEKTKKIDNSNDNKSSSTIGFILFVLCVFGFLVYKNLLSGKISLTLCALTLFGGFQLYGYLKTEIGSKFKIPLNKISEIKKDGNNVEIFFINGEDKKDTYKIYKIEDKGIAIIESMKEYVVLNN